MQSLFNHTAAEPEFTLIGNKWVIVFSEYELAIQNLKDINTFINYTIISDLGQLT